MASAAFALIALVAVLQTYFFILESFLWTRPAGRRAFGLTDAAAAQTQVLAANQGVYNAFLAAGLVWGLASDGLVGGRPVLTFFLGCVLVAGLVGGATASRKILVVQALPAALALSGLWLVGS